MRWSDETVRGFGAAVACAWVLRGLGWLAPWSRAAGRPAYATLDAWGDFVANPGTLWALACIAAGALMMWGLWQRSGVWTFVGSGASWAVGALLSVGFYSTGADPPASMYLGAACAAWWVMWRQSGAVVAELEGWATQGPQEVEVD